MKIIFTGGGSGGHVVPAITLIKLLKKNPEFQIYYVGSINGIEKSLVSNLVSEYYPISTGKLRRYISIENFIDIFKIAKGLIDALLVLIKFPRDTLVFSTGGFVSLPVVIAAFILRKTIYIHEQTSRVGLANKIASIFASKIFVSFHESLKYFPKCETQFSGYPVRDDFFDTNIRINIFQNIKLQEIKKPIMFITGGGNGSKLINDLIKNNLNALEKEYFIIHQVGKNHISEFMKIKSMNYYPVDFLGDEIIDIYKLASVIISRAGAGTVCELLALGKKSIFIPLKIAQKNEQYFNALECKNKLNSIIITEDELPTCNFMKIINELKSSSIVNLETRNNGSQFLLNKIFEFYKV